MSEVGKYIGDLLYDHECVIVPELGGFLSSYTPAAINLAQHTVVPPSRKVAFNVFLKHNDGLLASRLVATEGLAYGQAVREIEHFVSVCHDELNSGKKFVVDRVGILHRDAEMNIQFEPFRNVNYLKDSFGFAPVQFLPASEKEYDQVVEQQLREFITLRPSIARPRKPVVVKKSRRNLVNTVLLTGSVLWFCMNVYLVAPDHINLASLNPFTGYTKTETKDQSPVSMPPVYTQPTVVPPETVYVSTAPAGPPVASTDPVPTLEEKIHSGHEQANYFVIAGAFRSRANAMKKVNELQAQGFSNARLVEGENKLNLVCYDGFASREEAFSELNRLKALKKEGWIFPR